MTMQQLITGKAYVLGDNVDTDQIIPAQYLTFNPSIPEEYKQFGKYALSSVPPAQAGLPKGHVPFHTQGRVCLRLSRSSSRARISAAAPPANMPRSPWPRPASRRSSPSSMPASSSAIPSTAATSFPSSAADRLCENVCTGDELRIDVTASVLHNLTTKEDWPLKSLGEVAPILEAGGLFPYARKVGMLGD